jgi:hypothetical protein
VVASDPAIVASAFAALLGADGAGVDSPFAVALVRHLTDRGVEIDRVFRLVTDHVLDATDNKQQPFMYGSLSGKESFYFHQP